jgi:hypothetical protein
VISRLFFRDVRITEVFPLPYYSVYVFQRQVEGTFPAGVASLYVGTPIYARLMWLYKETGENRYSHLFFLSFWGHHIIRGEIYAKGMKAQRQLVDRGRPEPPFRRGSGCYCRSRFSPRLNHHVTNLGSLSIHKRIHLRRHMCIPHVRSTQSFGNTTNHPIPTLYMKRTGNF